MSPIYKIIIISLALLPSLFQSFIIRFLGPWSAYNISNVENGKKDKYFLLLATKIHIDEFVQLSELELSSFILAMIMLSKKIIGSIMLLQICYNQSRRFLIHWKHKNNLRLWKELCSSRIKKWVYMWGGVLENNSDVIPHRRIGEGLTNIYTWRDTPQNTNWYENIIEFICNQLSSNVGLVYKPKLIMVVTACCLSHFILLRVIHSYQNPDSDLRFTILWSKNGRPIRIVGRILMW